MSERSRGALITVLWSWVAFAATAAWFGHDLGQVSTSQQASSGQVQPIGGAAIVPLQPVTNPALPDAYHVLFAAGVVGLVATAIAAVAFAIEAARYAHAHQRKSTFALMAVPPVVAAAWIGGLQFLPSGTASVGRLSMAVVWLLLGVAGIAGSTQAVCTIIKTTEFTARTWRIGAISAAAVAAAMLVATGATVVWGITFRAGQVRPGDASGWLVVTTIMAVTTARAVIALIGARRASAPGEPAVA